MPVWIHWVVTAASLLAALVVWLSAEGSGGESSARPVTSEELEVLRLGLATSRRENEELRRELDRLVAVLGGQAVTAGGPDAAAGGGSGAPAAEEGARSRLEGLADDVRRALAAGARDEAARAVAELTRLGAAARPALEDLYRGSDDPATRRLLLPALAMVGGRERGMEFLLRELETETDPGLRDAILFASSAHVTAETAPVFAAEFTRAASDRDAAPELRAVAVRSLLHAEGPEAERALAEATGDPAESVRIAAYRTLASRPGARARLEQALSREGSPRVREIAECHLLLARPNGPGPR